MHVAGLPLHGLLAYCSSQYSVVLSRLLLTGCYMASVVLASPQLLRTLSACIPTSLLLHGIFLSKS
jgi:hypothetical protein